MTNSSDLSAKIAAALSEAIVPVLERAGYTGIQYAQIGNGEYPDTVVLVPAEERRFKGAIYIFASEDNGKNKVMQALNDCADIPYPEREAFAHVVAAYPPGENQVLTVVRRNTPRHNTGFGGGTGLRASLTQLAGRDMVLRLVPTTPASLTVRLTEGFYRIGARSYYTHDNSSFLDVTPYIPASSSEARYIGVGVDEFQAPVILEGATFTIPNTTPANYIPVNWGASVASLGWIYLPGDITAVDNHIQDDTTKRYAPGSEDLDYVQATDPGAVGAGTLWIDTSGGTGNWVLKVRNDDNSDWEAIGGGGGGSMSSFLVGADTGTDETVGDADTVTFEGGTGIETSVDAPATITFTLADTAVAPDTYSLPTITIDQQGRITFAEEYTLVEGDIPNLSASKITSGTLDNARVNWAAPGAIGSTTPSTGAFTTLNTSDAVVFNDAGADVDFRVETDGDANALFVDGGTNSVGIGVAPQPSIKLGITNTFGDSAPAFNSGCQIDVTQTGASTTGLLAFRLISKVNPGSSNTISQVYAQSGLAIMNGPGTITNAYANISRVDNLSTGTIGTAYGLALAGHTNSGGGTINTGIGLEIGSQTVATTNIALRTNAGNVIFNETGDANTDVRMEGDTNANLFFLDASADTVNIGSTFRHTGTHYGIFNVTPVTRPTITGSRGGNAALADLLTKGATLGLWIDSTS